MFHKKEIILYIFISYLFVVLQGCSVFMAVKQPPKKDLNVLNTGTHRSAVIAELGTPLLSEEREGKKVDVFSFKQGYNKPTKAGRALFHGVADVFTLGLWEVIGTPTEMIIDGKVIKVEVIYNHEDRVEKVNFLETKPNPDTFDK